MDTQIINIGNRIVNQYLLRFNNGIIIIDTSYPGYFNSFAKKFKALGFSKDEIKFIVLTHAHDDHAGFLNELLDFCDAPVILHEKAVERLKRGQNVFEGGCSTRLAYTFCLLMKLFGKKHLFPKLDKPERYIILQDNPEVLKQHGFPVELIELPGHTADSIGLILDNKIFCGDAAMNGFPSQAKHTIWIENIEMFQQSWNKIIETGVEMVYPSHGKPFPTQEFLEQKDFMKGRKLIPLKE
ncbi:MBL fold metallo-hydrolase [Defluviitalea saccharophila]|uniref:MBL fold metallo-hydrolase n=1 Tax=Defluviitalea saccharophila TaxID=879970 RepID=A0ABZ2Y2Y3_9FIRM